MIPSWSLGNPCTICSLYIESVISLVHRQQKEGEGGGGGGVEGREKCSTLWRLGMQQTA